MARFYTWNGATGLFTDAADWIDNSDGNVSDGTVPGTLDTATLSGGTIGGTGTVDTFVLNGSETVGGTLRALTNLNQNAGTLTIAAGGDLTAPYIYTRSLALQPGAALHLTGAIRNPGSSNAFPDALDLVGTASVSGLLDGSAGQIAIGTNTQSAALDAFDASIQSWSAVIGGGQGQSGSALLTAATWSVRGGTAASGSTNSGGYALIGNGYPNGTGTGGTLMVASGAEFDAVNIVVGVNAGATGTLSVTQGAMVSSTGVGNISVVGNQSGSAGTATVDGANSSWTDAGTLLVGDEGSGTLVVSNHGSVSAATAIDVGDAAGGSGHVTVESAGVLSSAGSIEVGNGAGASGTVEVLAGGTLATTGPLTTANYALTIGNTAGYVDVAGDTLAAASGLVLVSGTGSLLNLNGNGIKVGNRGTGSLTISAGGSVSVATENSDSIAAAGIGYSGSGTLLVTGAGSHFSADGSVYVAHAGAGTLTVANDATLTAGNATSGLSIGSGGANGTGGSGVATVTTGGYLQSRYAISVGGGGDSGTLDVSGGGTVESTGRLVVGYGATIDGTLVAGTGVVNIGAGSTLLADGTSITSSGTSAIQIGAAAGDSATVSVSGAAALLEAAGHYISIGSNGAGSLSVTQGGTVEASSDFVTSTTYDAATYVGSNATGAGTLTVDGVGSAYNATGQINVGNSGSGTLVVSNQGTVNSGNDGGNLGLIVGNNTGATGRLLVTGTGSLLSNVLGRFIVGGAGSGAMTIAAGGVVQTTRTISPTVNTNADNNAGAYLAYYAASTGSVEVTGTHSLWSIATNLFVGTAGTGTLRVENSGAIQVGTTLGLAPESTGTGSITLDSTGMVEVGGTTGAVAGAIVVDAAGELKGHGMVAAAVRNAGTVDAIGGAMVLTGPATGSGGYTIEPGAVLELAAASGNTANVVFDGGGTLRIDTPGSFTGTISTGASGGTLTLPGDVGATGHVAGSTLVVTGSEGTFDYALDGTGPVTVACFARGTLIDTPGGGVAVEALREGDLVTTRGGCAPVVWIGRRRMRPAAHPEPARAHPIRIRASAFADGLPRRDLLLSPEHAILVDGALIPAHRLVNEASVWRERVDEVAYFHVELPCHDILFAEGLACESWLDTGSRGSFENAPVVTLHPDFAANAASDAWAGRACAPLVEEGPLLDAARAMLAAQAARLGRDVSLALDGPGRHAITVPAGACTVRLLSPAADGVGADLRRLGCAISALRLDGRGVALDDARLRAGFHDVERDGARAWRWSDGCGVVALGAQSIPRVLEVNVVAVAGRPARAA